MHSGITAVLMHMLVAQPNGQPSLLEEIVHGTVRTLLSPIEAMPSLEPPRRR